jgi:hypothetical protein
MKEGVPNRDLHKDTHQLVLSVRRMHWYEITSDLQA